MAEEGGESLGLFLKSFVSGITSSFPGKIDGILLSGSAARGDFKIGESDIDMHVVLKDDRDVPEAERAASRLFWELNRKYGLRLVRSYGRKGAFGFTFLSGASPSMEIRPVYVVGPSGWRLKLRPKPSLLSLLGIEPMLWRGRLRNGLVLYGRNLLEDPEALRTAGRRRHLSYDVLVTLFILPLFIVMPERVLRRCSKALLLSFDDRFCEIRALAHQPPHGQAGRTAGAGNGGLKMAAQAYRLKSDFESESARMGMLGKLWFCIRTPPMIFIHSFEPGSRPARPG